MLPAVSPLDEEDFVADLAHALLRAGQVERAHAAAEEAAGVARRRGAKVWLAYAEWVKGGPQSPAFVELAEATGAALLKRLAHPTAGVEPVA